MKEIVVELPKKAYLPGERVEGTVKLAIDDPVKARAVKLNAVGLEDIQVTVSSGKHSHTYREANYMLKQEIFLKAPPYSPVSDEKLELQPGTYKFEFDFKLPDNALPSYKGSHAHIKYELEARVDVPLWLDICYDRPFFVFRDRRALNLLTDAVQFQSENYTKPYDDKPGISVELTKTGFIAGEVIEGYVTLKNVTASKIRKIDVRLMGVEFAVARNHQRSVKQYDYEMAIPMGDVVESVPKRFNLPIPRNAPSSYEGVFSNLRWAVEVGLDIPFGFDVEALHPVEILL